MSRVVLPATFVSACSWHLIYDAPSSLPGRVGSLGSPARGRNDPAPICAPGAHRESSVDFSNFFFQPNGHPRAKNSLRFCGNARGGCVPRRGGRDASPSRFLRSAREETAKQYERLGSLNVVFSEREGGRKIVSSTAAFYLSVSSRHLTDRIQLMIRRERMCVQERNVFSRWEILIVCIFLFFFFLIAVKRAAFV